MHKSKVDVVVVGSGMGGSTAALNLAPAGASILILERGDFLPRERQNWSPQANFVDKRYKNAEPWYTSTGKQFLPGVHYYVGGNTKVYGAALPRFRSIDFTAVEHRDGISPEWPFGYDDLEPYYERAEAIYRVHADQGEDPTDGYRSSPFPYPPVPHDPTIAELSDRLTDQGLHPSHLPLGLDVRPQGLCERCNTCDGYPCKVGAKSDAEVCATTPALDHPNVDLWTGAYVASIETDISGKTATGVTGTRNGERFHVEANHVLVACGAANSAALLLRSQQSSHPRGLGNSHDLVGRNYMVHNNSALMAIDPTNKKLQNDFQKTLSVNDFYEPHNVADQYPLGNMQLLGKIHEGTLQGARPRLPRWARTFVTNRSVEWWIMSEDLPTASNRVHLRSDESLQVDWKPNNMESHRRLLKAARSMMRKAGYPLVFSETLGIETNSHQCGTLKMGEDETSSVVDPEGKIHSLTNVYVVDSSVFPSSAACNPALTIAALALKTTDHLTQSW